jgi:hypothetical protein
MNEKKLQLIKRQLELSINTIFSLSVRLSQVSKNVRDKIIGCIFCYVLFGAGKGVRFGVISFLNIIIVLAFAESTDQKRLLGFEVVTVVNVDSKML